jgi:biotin transport system substrate-specific component
MLWVTVNEGNLKIMHGGLKAEARKTRVNTAAQIVGCALLTAIGARLAVRLPFTPVPVTWQVPAVLFAGLVLGPRAALASQGLYLLAGLAGAPVFAFGAGGAAYLFNPYGTGGYLLSYPIAAWVAARVRRRAPEESRFAPLFACGAGLFVIYALGCVWLTLWLRLSPAQALLQGAGWFLAWDIAKSLFAVLAARMAGRAEEIM